MIRGKRYSFRIISETYNGIETNFSILSVDNYTNRYSSINNLNFIMSELKVDPKDTMYQDSSWTIPREDAEMFSQKIKRILNNSISLRFLESQLDDDRFESEWENRVTNETNL